MKLKRDLIAALLGAASCTVACLPDDDGRAEDPVTTAESEDDPGIASDDVTAPVTPTKRIDPGVKGKGERGFEVTSVRLFGSPSNGHTYTGNFTLPAVQGDDGALFVGASLAGEAQVAVPAGTPAWSGQNAVVKFGPDGAVAWSSASSTPIASLVLEGGFVWAAGFANATQPDGTGETCSITKLDANTGALVDSFHFDFATTTTHHGQLVGDGAGGVWFVGSADQPFSDGTTTWTPPPESGWSTFVMRPGTTDIKWIPGQMFDARLDPSGNLFVGSYPPYGTAFTMGGEKLPATTVVGDAAVGRFTKALVHENSALVDSTTLVLVPGNEGVFSLDGSVGPLVRSFRYQGSTLTADQGVNETDVPATISRGAVESGRLMVWGTSDGRSGKLSGHDVVLPWSSLIAVYDEHSLALEHLIQYYVAPTDYPVEPSTIVFDHDAGSMLIVTPFDGDVEVGQTKVAANGYAGLALIELEIH